MSDSPLARFWLENRDQESPIENTDVPQDGAGLDDPSLTPDIYEGSEEGVSYTEATPLVVRVSLRGQSTLGGLLSVEADDLLDALRVVEDRGWLVGVDMRTQRTRAYRLDDILLIEES